MADITHALKSELRSLEGMHRQNPETGGGLNEDGSYLNQYTNRLFGAPFQLLNSVDRRFSEINMHLGNQYLRNFMLNSPILHIRPGSPKYTGKEENFNDLLREVYMAAADSDSDTAAGAMTSLMKSTAYSIGNKLQRRMFGFKETYTRYIRYVNYMCRSMAAFLALTGDEENQPNGAPSNKDRGLQPFSKFDWATYRWLTSTQYQLPADYFVSLLGSTYTGETLITVGRWIAAGYNIAQTVFGTVIQTVDEGIQDGDSLESMFAKSADTIQQESAKIIDQAVKDTQDGYQYAKDNTMLDAMKNKVTQVLFMIEPGSFTETLENTIANSQIEQMLSGITDGIGNEIAFMTNSNIDVGVIKGLADQLGNTATGMVNFVNSLVEPVAGGWTGNLFHGAVNAIKGQRMIYPKIYQGSSSRMSYNFTINLRSPYGDVYNYYMNIVVPLMHLIALTAPRMLSSNSITSPFIVQAFVPGMCTCDMGIVTNLTITKNPETNRVSVNGFPLDVQVKLTIEELYNSLSISPSNDPASFLFNETLNDYMANLGGLQPTDDTWTKQRVGSMNALAAYWDKSSGELIQDIAEELVDGIENMIKPSSMD